MNKIHTVSIQKKTIDLHTGASKTELVNAQILPAKPGTCQECGTPHAPEQPHNAQSLLYQYAFYGREGRWPTWNDAMAHCEPFTREQWTRLLEERGIVVAIENEAETNND
ncbi:hypothetical protein [Citrobacter freundii]|uniref:hypothetical protein n=1 Tax=Citrobacter freundii TaxID=546 RepID=UPI003862661E